MSHSQDLSPSKTVSWLNTPEQILLEVPEHLRGPGFAVTRRRLRDVFMVSLFSKLLPQVPSSRFQS